MDSEKKEDVKEDYNPFEHRQVEKPNSNIRSTANIIKASLGSGLLAGPLAFSNSGWGVGLIGTVIIGFICGHCIHILVATSRGVCQLEKKPLLGYADTCKAAFTHGPKAVRPYATAASGFAVFALVCTHLGVCCIYTVLISDSTKQIVERYAPTFIVPVEYYCLIMMIPLCVLCQIKHLKLLAVFSLLANVLLVLVYLICLYYIFGGDISIADKKIAGDPARWPVFLSTVLFAMEGIGVVMPVENTMKKPQSFLGFPSVLFVSMSCIVFLYSTLGLFGYLRYGDVLKGSITLNLPVDDWPAICAKVFIATSILFTYPLQFYVVVDIFTKYTQPYVSKKYVFIFQFISRIIGVCFCGGIGMALPLLEQIINLVGSIFYSILGLMIPAIIETVFRWKNLGKYNWVLIKNIVILAIGITCLISGCTVTVMDISKRRYDKIE